ncbi:putative tRNA methyltransferase complex GCD14 subunit [Monocercomonoides exilis]|uniref:putative tRNA methyltransferase complex GCD14 subunit n=1 Tax=Monocercomonoides exilis TaxID=2049356 RepID=UPI003559B36A|nr:putative tRNA methyltransferase complex GCD14 subunit [Monocercomonoides exilis]|eukprot:MONOS_7447.1-p1 / transcript=MONOS_7447.1 / gene=MONOS_7447 / organism=Monocercomonoides_exilis_PA203 / gene_product=tRNA / transcript_product=tRNA / location=Mono_scaffold00254:70137-71978(-) / protein_length=501 / sequence_SO=supercontig / SO=protein_coding / is_pseudo=false
MKLVKSGDFVIVYEGPSKMNLIRVSEGKSFNNKYGLFLHDSIIGSPFGSKLMNKAKNGFVYILKPTPPLIAQCQRRRTQVLYQMDISMVILRLDIKPGSVVVESGTGSGVLSTAIIQALAPTGHLYTFEFNKVRADAAKEEFDERGLGEFVTVTHRDVVTFGLGKPFSPSQQYPPLQPSLSTTPSDEVSPPCSPFPPIKKGILPPTFSPLPSPTIEIPASMLPFLDTTRTNSLESSVSFGTETYSLVNASQQSQEPATSITPPLFQSTQESNAPNSPILSPPPLSFISPHSHQSTTVPLCITSSDDSASSEKSNTPPMNSSLSPPPPSSSSSTFTLLPPAYPYAHSVFLDLPNPWEVIPSAHSILLSGGLICCFSPCVEQVHRNCLQLKKSGFEDIETIECLLLPYEVRTRLKDYECGWYKPPPAAKEGAEQQDQSADAKEDELLSPKRKQKEDSCQTNSASASSSSSASSTSSKTSASAMLALSGRTHTSFLTFARKKID